MTPNPECGPGDIYPLSHSKMQVFWNCELRFYYQYIARSVVDLGSEHSEYGNRVHKVLEDMGTGARALGDETDETRGYTPLVERILKEPGETYFELSLGVNDKQEPCDFFDPLCTFRGKYDVIVNRGSEAYLLDWKTGKVKTDESQLKLGALLLMLNFPLVNTVRTGFIWLRYNKITRGVTTRDMLPHLWGAFLADAETIETTVGCSNYVSKPSGLCGYCPAQEICPDAKKTHRR